MAVRRSDKEIALSLIQSGSVRRTAEALGISERSVFARKKTQSFRNTYNELLDDMLSAVTGRLQAGALAAVNALIDIVCNTETNDQTRAHAAVSLLSNLLKFREATDIVRRLEALEAQQNENN